MGNSLPSDPPHAPGEEPDRDIQLRRWMAVLVCVSSFASGWASAEAPRVSLPDPPAGVVGADLLEQGEFSLAFFFHSFIIQSLNYNRRCK